MFAEPLPTALLLTTFGTLLALAVFFSRATERVNVPVVLIFLITGILAGSEGIGGIVFENYAFAVRLGTIALVLILFDGFAPALLDGTAVKWPDSASPGTGSGSGFFWYVSTKEWARREAPFA